MTRQHDRYIRSKFAALKANEPRLDRHTVSIIRAAYQIGVVKRWMAEHYGVSSGTIDNVCAYRTWASIAPKVGFKLTDITTALHEVRFHLKGASRRDLEASISEKLPHADIALTFGVPVEYVDALAKHMGVREAIALGVQPTSASLPDVVARLRAEVDLSERSPTASSPKMAQRLIELREASRLCSLLLRCGAELPDEGSPMLEGWPGPWTELFALLRPVKLDRQVPVDMEALAQTHRLDQVRSGYTRCDCAAGPGTGFEQFPSPTLPALVCEKCDGLGEVPTPSAE